MEFDNDGNLLVTDYGTKKLIKISPSGEKSEIATIESVADVVVDENNVIYALSESGKIYKIEPGKL
jgi:outer membrane protein assembly factor BamB